MQMLAFTLERKEQTARSVGWRHQVRGLFLGVSEGGVGGAPGRPESTSQAGLSLGSSLS